MNILGFKIGRSKSDTTRNITSGLPPGRVNKPDGLMDIATIQQNLKHVKLAFYWQAIPEIRKLFAISSPLSLAVTTLVQLSNTGFKVKFSNGIPPAKRLAMTNHLYTVSKEWGFGTAGLHGLIDKILYQLLLGGAHSGEWVIKNDLSGINYLSFLNPESIRPVYNSSTNRYDYFQEVRSMELISTPQNLIKLNPKTFKYFALMSGEESPTGIPPFLAALPDLVSQKNMLNNINFIVEQIGLMGFLELVMEKPAPKDGESEDAYRARLTNFLTEAKNSINTGLKDGVIAGYKGDHDFEFNSISKDLSSLPSIFSIVQKAVSAGLKTPSVFMEGPDSKTETQISIIFTKLLAQLGDIQNIVSHILEYGFELELLLAGYKPEGLKVTFDPSTLTDSLKKAQTDEINSRVGMTLYNAGLIELDDFARIMGYDQASQDEPRIDPNAIAGEQKKQVAKEEKSKKNNTYDKTVRDKKKDQPKRR